MAAECNNPAPLMPPVMFSVARCEILPPIQFFIQTMRHSQQKARPPNQAQDQTNT
jgi:hypothetical protein